MAICSNTCRTLGVAITLALSAGAQAAAVATAATVSASARYQNDAAGPNTLSHGDPGTAAISATAGPGDAAFTLDQGTEVFDGAIARARSEIDSSLSTSSIGVYSHAGGYSPGFASPPDDVLANASVRWTLSFIVHSAPEVTSAQLNAELGIDGSLVAATFGGAHGVGDAYASVAASLSTVSSFGSVNWVDARATLDRFGGLDVSGPWASGFTLLSQNNASIAYAEVLYHDTYLGLITVPTNEVFTYEIELSSEAFVLGAFENWAVADFFNTATFDLEVETPGLSLERIPTAVPLPAPIALLLAPLALLGLAARRQSTRASR